MKQSDWMDIVGWWIIAGSIVILFWYVVMGIATGSLP